MYPATPSVRPKATGAAHGNEKAAAEAAATNHSTPLTACLKKKGHLLNKCLRIDE
jgi:hypothetical protein